MPLGIFYLFIYCLLRLLCFILGLVICLLLLSFGQVPGLGGAVSGWFAPSSSLVLLAGPQWSLPLAGWWRGDFAGAFVIAAPSPLFLPSASRGSCSNSRWPPSAALSASLSPPSPLLAKAPSLLWLRINNMP